MHASQGRIQDFTQKWEFRPAIRKAGGGRGGVCPFQAPDTKIGGGGGGGGVLSASGPIRKVGVGGGGGGGCLPYDDTVIYILVCARVRASAGWRVGGGAAIGARGRHFI